MVASRPDSHQPDAAELEDRYQQRLSRYVTAMCNQQPDRVPIRPFLAEFCGKLAGFDPMQQTHDFQLAFQAVRETARVLDCDALVSNMVYVWTGLTQALGLKYYGVPGVGSSPDHGFQYLEPSEGEAWMRPEEYDHLIEDPTGYLYEVWLPRVSSDIVGTGGTVTLGNQLALVRGGMSMLHYFHGFGAQQEQLRKLGMPSAIAGILKAPLDILADKLRGYLGLVDDLHDRPEKVLAACEALAPHLLHTALAGADPDKLLPVGHWMHRSCVPFVRPEHFRDIHWPTIKPMFEHLWEAGHQTLLYAEGSWGHHLESLAELPAGSAIYHVDQDDIFEVHRVLGGRFCLSGGVPNTLLSFGSPEKVGARCKQIIDQVAIDGGYIMDASAIVQEDARVENIQAMIDATHEYGRYDGRESNAIVAPAKQLPTSTPAPMPDRSTLRPPGTCVPWSEKLRELARIERHEDLVERIWYETDGLANMFIWHILVSF